jgi:hypothetical protein
MHGQAIIFYLTLKLKQREMNLKISTPKIECFAYICIHLIRTMNAWIKSS